MLDAVRKGPLPSLFKGADGAPRHSTIDPAMFSGEGSGPEDGRLARGAFPRGFGREGDKFKQVRTENLVKKSGGKARR